MVTESNNANFIDDPRFVKWILKPDPETESYWNDYLDKNPDQKEKIEKAAFLVKNLSGKGKALADKEVELLWNRIETTIESNRKKRLVSYRWLAAASILLIVGLAGTLWFNLPRVNHKVYINTPIARTSVPGNEVKLVFSDKTEEIISSATPTIKYCSNGDVQINSGKVLKRNLPGKDATNELIVPKGRRSNILLSDGTRLCLNSGSKAIFPVVFKKEKREIYIEGEAYFEVAHDKKRPFYVAANHIKVRVLGTKFNVRDYADDPDLSVVLLEGKVQALVASRKVTMKPNQMLNYEKNARSSVLKNVDALDFTSWKDGWLCCNREKLDKIAARLARYYNVEIQFADLHAKELTLTGKLDLKSDCKAIFDVISSTAPIKYKIVNNKILISMNNN